MVELKQTDTTQSASFPSLDEAALAFAAEYYPFTLATGRECSASLYVQSAEDGVQYFYGDIQYGSERCVTFTTPDENWTVAGRRYAGSIHTHPPEPYSYLQRLAGCDRREFSGHDVAAYYRLLRLMPLGCNFSAYVAAPSRKVLRFIPETGGEIEVGKF